MSHSWHPVRLGNMSTVSQDNYVMEIASPQQDWAKQKETAQRKERRMGLGGELKHADCQPVSGISLKGNLLCFNGENQLSSSRWASTQRPQHWTSGVTRVKVEFVNSSHLSNTRLRVIWVEKLPIKTHFGRLTSSVSKHFPQLSGRDSD